MGKAAGRIAQPAAAGHNPKHNALSSYNTSIINTKIRHSDLMMQAKNAT
jgi:hypothetical protein